MKVIGITGGVGCGKTSVLNEIEKRYNAKYILADDVAKLLMLKGQSVYNRVVATFGKEILLDSGEIDRQFLSKIIFNDDEKRLKLNSIVHPEVKKYIMNQIAEYREEKNIDYLFVEAALLIEDHYEVFCDEFWYIYTSVDVRRTRLKAGRGYSDERIDRMILSQLSEKEYKNACKYLIDNSGTLVQTMNQIEKILEES